MKITYLFAGVLILGFAGAAVADDQFFVFIQLKDKNCRVITDKATIDGKEVMQVGKQVYQTREEAEANIKVICVNP
jgi:hypothetical protein